MRPYYLHRRKGIWYAELVSLGTGEKLTVRSTGTQNRDQAIFTVADWMMYPLQNRDWIRFYSQNGWKHFGITMRVPMSKKNWPINKV